jgi:hypothetical protein
MAKIAKIEYLFIILLLVLDSKGVGLCTELVAFILLGKRPLVCKSE